MLDLHSFNWLPTLKEKGRHHIKRWDFWLLLRNWWLGSKGFHVCWPHDPEKQEQFFYFNIFVERGIDSKALRMLGKCSTTEPCSEPGCPLYMCSNSLAYPSPLLFTSSPAWTPAVWCPLFKLYMAHFNHLCHLAARPSVSPNIVSLMMK